jgi:TolB-like protein
VRALAAAACLYLAAGVAADPGLGPLDAPAPAPPPHGLHTRLAVLPPENLSGAGVAGREVRTALELALVRRGVDVVSSDLVERFLAKHRMRYTGGVDRAAAKAAAEDMGVEGLVVTTVDLYSRDPPRVGLTLRVVGADEKAQILWIDGASRAGDESPGLLGLGLVGSFGTLQERVIGQLASSLSAYLEGRGSPAPPCPDGRRYRPRVPYRSPLLATGSTYTIAVVPFRNLTGRHGAGDVLTLGFVRQLAAVPTFRVVEPGIVRGTLLRGRIVMEGGVSLDQVRTFLGQLEADLVVAGDLVEYVDGAGGAPPALNFTATVLDAHTGKIAWQSTSFNRGDDGVWLFDWGRIATAGALSCRMIRADIEGMLLGAPPPRPALPQATSNPAQR